ncbi:MAG: N-acetylornithine carbamoyltransferase [Candidatus Eisenbacteria bacterium]|nr:N-acetylornithine carbamoyltransferase [Candidatus Eisenbacteria bacterium]
MSAPVLAAAEGATRVRHFVSHLDWSPAEIDAMIDLAQELKAEGLDVAAHRGVPGGEAARPSYSRALQDRVLGLVFFNPSLRTLFSSQAAMQRLGGSAIPLHVGQGTWDLEWRDGVRMDGKASEHVREGVPVLSRYAEALGVRCFAGMRDADEDAQDSMIRAFAAHATVPVINLESAAEHPCQALAGIMTARELLGATAGRTLTVTWAPQAKPTPMAVPHSALLGAAWAGMNVRLLHPEGYELGAKYVEAARTECARRGSRFEISHDPAALGGTDILYVKSWGRRDMYGRAEEQAADFARLAGWRVSEARLAASQAPVLHCLPVRRDVVIDAAVLDGPRSRVVDEAENRMWVFMAVLLTLLKGEPVNDSGKRN